MIREWVKGARRWMCAQLPSPCRNNFERFQQTTATEECGHCQSFATVRDSSSSKRWKGWKNSGRWQERTCCLIRVGRVGWRARASARLSSQSYLIRFSSPELELGRRAPASSEALSARGRLIHLDSELPHCTLSPYRPNVDKAGHRRVSIGWFEITRKLGCNCIALHCNEQTPTERRAEHISV